MSRTAVVETAVVEARTVHPHQPPVEADPFSPRRVKVSRALRFYHQVLGLDHLHFGLWNGEPMSLEGLKVAQERYAERLCEWIPEGVQSVLDVGSGTGATTEKLLRRGYDVEGLSPDPYQRRLFQGRVGAPFHLVRFQELEPCRRYDLVLMSESAQYIWLDALFPATLRAAPGGFLLVSDYFLVEPAAGALARSGHPLPRFRDLARRLGFELLEEEDISEQVAPTLDLARRWVDRFLGHPVGRLLARRGRAAHLGRRWFPGLARKAGELRRVVDSGEFRRFKRYLILLYRVPSS